MSAKQSAIELRAVSRRFGETRAVDDLSLSVNRGEIFALVGPDGAGKTTLMRLICGALSVDRGTISVDGVDVVAQTAQVQAAIGYMPQRFSLYPDLSVMENAQFYGEIFGVPPGDFAERARTLLEDFALWRFRERPAGELSGGMKQKLALCCALVHRPATLLLDEPTAGVDPLSRREFWKILAGINRGGTTILVSTPYMDEAERATRVGLLMNGRLVTTGAPGELRDGLRGDVVQIETLDRARARRALRGAPMVRSIEVFGETLHALVDSADAAIPQMQERLRDARVDAALRRIPATLEDAFVARLTA